MSLPLDPEGCVSAAVGLAGEPPSFGLPFGDWVAHYKVIEQDGQLEIAEVRILPGPRESRESAWISEALAQRPDGSEALHGPDGPTPAKPPQVPSGGLTARGARAGIRTSEAIENARQQLSWMGKKWWGHPVHSFSDAALSEPRRPGRRGHSDRFLAEISLAYQRAIDNGSRTPIKDVAERLREQGQPDSNPYVRDLIHLARRRELLTSAPPGKAGGRLTEKALRLLETIQEID